MHGERQLRRPTANVKGSGIISKLISPAKWHASSHDDSAYGPSHNINKTGDILLIINE
jgi:hypothetical protein